jgi:tetratricopeptide (TPR) repeat protein
VKKAGILSIFLFFVIAEMHAQGFPGKKIKSLLKSAWDIQFDNPDSAQYFISRAYAEFNVLKKNAHSDTVFKYKAELYNQQGIIHYLKSEYPDAIKNYRISLSAKESSGDTAGIAMSYNNIAVAFQYMGNVDEAIQNHFKAYKLRSIIEDAYGRSMSLNNIGLLYKDQKLYDKAMDYFENSLRIADSIKNDYLQSAIWNNIGSIHASQENYDEALKWFKKSLKNDSLSKNTGGYILTLSNIGQLLEGQNKLDEAEAYLLRAIKLSEENNFIKGLAMAYRNYQAVENKRGNYQKGIAMGEKSLKYFVEINELFSQKTVLENLADMNFKTGNYKKAYEWQREFMKIKDSISSIDKKEALLQNSMKFDFEQEQFKDSVLHAKREKELVLRDKLNENQLKSEKQFRYLLIIISGLLLIFGIMMFNRFKVTRKQKQVIEAQKLIVEEKNREVHDSLKYAKRIQEAILPSIKSMNESLKNGFVLYLPKEVVAGDFYWMEHHNNKVYFAVADCTGHGVPGAMMSVVCSNALSKALIEENKTDTGNLLDKTREIVIEKLMRSGEEVNDGMDISICRMDFSDPLSVKLQWSGANNPLYIIRKNSHDAVYNLIELSPDKQPIGKYSTSHPFTAQNINLSEGDTLYLFSDGYSDQFGGEKGKKYKASRLKELLLSIQSEKMESQKNILLHEFDKWKRDLEQIDDVTIIGIRI